MTNLDAITVLWSTDGSPVNKIVRRAPDGTITKGKALEKGAYHARTVPIPDLDALAEVLREVGARPDACISLSVFVDPPAEELLVLSRKAIATAIGVDKTDRAKLIGYHCIDNQWAVARLKENMTQSSFALFDRDQTADMPPDLAGMGYDDWRAAIGALFPGFETCGAVMVPSTSTRITIDGAAQDATSAHTIVQVSDPADLPRAWSQAVQRSLITPFSPVPWEEPTMLGFAKPIRDRKGGTDQVVAVSWWTVFDRSVAAPGRLVFDGAPVVEGPGLGILAPTVQIYSGSRLDLRKVPNLTRTELKGIAEAVALIKGVKPRIVLRKAPGVAGQARITGVDVTIADLTMDLEVETEAGWTTVGELYRNRAGHTRVQSPFRDSASWAAFYSAHQDGTPFIFDTGTQEKHVLRSDGLDHSWAVILDWLKEDYAPRFRYKDGSFFSEAHNTRIKPTTVTPTAEVVQRLAMASDAPRDEGGVVKWHMLPGHFATWARVAYGELVRSLPYEEALVETSPETAEEFGTQLSALLTTLVSINLGGESRHSLGAWARRFAQMEPGAWRRVKTLDLWGRVTNDGAFYIGLLPTLAGQVKACPEIAEMTPAGLTRRCNVHGLSASGDNRITCDGYQFRLTVLRPEFVSSLVFGEAVDNELGHAVQKVVDRLPPIGGKVGGYLQ